VRHTHRDTIHTPHIDFHKGLITGSKKIAVGTKAVKLTTLYSKGEKHVFAASDKPTIIYGNNKKLMFSNVNLKDVNFMCSFNNALFRHSLAIETENSILFGKIEEIEKIQIKTVKLKEQPRRIAFHKESKTLSVLTIGMNENNTGEVNYVRLFHGRTYEGKLSVVLID